MFKHFKNPIIDKIWRLRINPFRCCYEYWTVKDEVKYILSHFGYVFAWYDFWVGFYYDRNNKRLYILPIPCIGFYIQLDFNY
jgi:hypothetical protein